MIYMQHIFIWSRKKNIVNYTHTHTYKKQSREGITLPKGKSEQNGILLWDVLC